jgi:TolB-like protein/DNA-binding winged helix-turn-helix (wHTH) protein/Flp pilus assembly protein TadD
MDSWGTRRGCIVHSTDRAFMARSAAPPPDRELDLGRYELRRGGEVVRLEKIPMELLILLAEHHGELVTRERLVERLWGPDVFVDTEHGINTAVRKVRAALGDNAAQPRYLQTVIGKGYRLVGPIRIIGAGRGATAAGDAPPSRSSEPAARQPLPDSAPLPPPALASLSSSRPRLPVYAGALLVVVAAAVGLLAFSARGARSASGEHASSILLAVLPLENLATGSADDYVADGLTEELIAAIGRAAPGELSVIARSTVQAYKNRTKPVRQVARELNVQYVLEGTVRRQQDRVRVTATLIRTADEAQVWADSYDGRLDDVLELQQQVASAVATAVGVKLARRPERTRRPLGLHEHEQHLRGRFHLASRETGSRARALEYFQAVAASQPESALGHLGIAEAYVRMANNELAPRAAMPAAMEAVDRALQLDPELAEAHRLRAAIALHYQWDWSRAERSLRQALVHDPNLASAHALLATVLSSAGRFDEALEPAARAYTLDPVAAWTTVGSPWQNLTARRWDTAIVEGARQLELAPGKADYLATTSLAYQRLGRTEEAVDAARRAFAKTPDNVGNAALAGHVLAEAGQIEEARRILDHLEALRRRGYVCAYNVAGVHAALREIDRAFELLEQGFRDRSG